MLKGQKKALFIFLLPPITFILLVMIYPLFQSFWYSLTNFYFLDNSPPKFIGLKNYIDLFSDTNFLLAFRNSLFFIILYVPISVVLATVIAALLDAGIRGVPIYRTLIFVPVCVGLTMATLMWLWILNPDGLLDTILKSLHLTTIKWLATETSTIVTAVIVTIWKNLGFYVVIMLAGLYAIPRELYEAANIDGAGKIKSFFSITLPLVKDSISLVGIMTIISAVKAFEQIWAVSRGGGTVDVLYTFMYKTTFRYFEMGKGAAISYIMAIFILIVSYLNIKYIKTEV